MTCTIGRDKLLSAMAAVTKVAGAKDYNPVWQSVRLQITAGRLHLAATNGQIWLNLDIEASGELEPVCIHAERFRDVAGSLSSDLIGLQSTPGKLLLFGGKGKRSLATIAMEEFPGREFEAKSTFRIEADRLRDALGFALPHIADIGDPAAASLAAVYLVADEGVLKAIGTNKSELAQLSLGETADAIDAAIPAKVADLANDLAAGDVEIGLSDTTIEICWPGGRILGPLLEGPITTSFLLKATKHNLAFAGGEGGEPFSCEVEAKEMLRALRGVRPLGDMDSSSRGKRLKLTLNGSAILSTASHEGSAEEEVQMDLSEAGDLEIGFSSSRMERVLRGFGDRVLTVAMRGPMDPMKFEAAGLPDRVALLFPMKV